MGAERRNYVMSVELAMQREMAYRKRLESLQAERVHSSSTSSSITTSSKKDPLVSQVTTTTFTQSPRMTPGPRPPPNPMPHRYFGPRPGQVPPPRPNTWNHEPTPSPTPLMRPPCPMSGPTHSANHHKRKQPEAHQVGGNFYCRLCEVDCTTPFNLKMHLKGHKHRAKFSEGKSAYTKAAAGGGTGAKGRVQCDLCGIWRTDEFSFRLHLNGKNHILKLYATNEKKLKGPDGGSSAI